MRLASALLLSAGAHAAALSVAGGLGGAAASAPPPVEPRLAAPLTVALHERTEEPAPPRPAYREARRATPHLSAGQLDVRPQVRTFVMPQYPDDVAPGTHGRVVLELLIARDGRVERVRVQRAEPPGLFERAAVQAFSRALFSPGMKGGAPVPARLRIEVTFGG